MAKDKPKTPSKQGNVHASNASLDTTTDPPTSPQNFALRLVLALIGVYYFFLVSSIPSHLRHPDALFRPLYVIGMVSASLFVAMSAFLVFWRHVLRRGENYRHLRLRTRKPIVVLTLSGVVAYFAFIGAFWSVLGFKSPLVFTFLSYAVLCALSFV